MLGENKMIRLLPLLKEYSDKTINDTIARWGIDPTDQRTVNDAKAAIQRFDQIKSALSQRLDIAIIPDEIKNKDYKNIDLYSYEDLLNLLRSLPERDEKIKKEAIKRFVEESGFDKSTIQSTVARFMTKKAALKLAVKDGLEDAGYSAEEVQGFIPKRLFKDDKYFNPRRNFHIISLLSILLLLSYCDYYYHYYYFDDTIIDLVFAFIVFVQSLLS